MREYQIPYYDEHTGDPEADEEAALENFLQRRTADAISIHQVNELLGESRLGYLDGKGFARRERSETYDALNNWLSEPDISIAARFELTKHPALVDPHTIYVVQGHRNGSIPPEMLITAHNRLSNGIAINARRLEDITDGRIPGEDIRQLMNDPYLRPIMEDGQLQPTKATILNDRTVRSLQMLGEFSADSTTRAAAHALHQQILVLDGLNTQTQVAAKEVDDDGHTLPLVRSDNLIDLNKKRANVVRQHSGGVIRPQVTPDTLNDDKLVVVAHLDAETHIRDALFNGDCGLRVAKLHHWVRAQKTLEND